MLRPNDVIEWFKLRAAAGRNEISQLTDGLMPGGNIVVGGSEANAKLAISILSNQQRIGRVTSIVDAKLNPDNPTTFDTAAIVQLMMMSKNESFFETLELVCSLIEQVVNDGHPIQVALQVAREQAERVPRL